MSAPHSDDIVTILSLDDVNDLKSLLARMLPPPHPHDLITFYLFVHVPFYKFFLVLFYLYFWFRF
jgi:hypothetical protein